MKIKDRYFSVGEQPQIGKPGTSHTTAGSFTYSVLVAEEVAEEARVRDLPQLGEEEAGAALVRTLTHCFLRRTYQTHFIYW